MPRMHQNALCDPQIPLDAKTQVRRNGPSMVFMETALGAPENEKLVDNPARCCRMNNFNFL
jgi:hypothetical protein